jgi:hypothetical protein
MPFYLNIGFNEFLYVFSLVHPPFLSNYISTPSFKTLFGFESIPNIVASTPHDT